MSPLRTDAVPQHVSNCSPLNPKSISECPSALGSIAVLLIYTTKTIIKNCQVLVKNLNFVAGMTRRFVSAKRLIRYFSNSSKLVEHRAQSPVREVKMLAVWPSIAEGFPTLRRFVSWPRRNAASYQPRNLNSSQVLDNFLLHITRELCGWESFCDRRPDC